MRSETDDRRKAIILVVDDEKPIADLIQKILEKEGHIAHTAGTGAEAVRRAAELKPTLIIMDITMPEMDGYEATQQIKTNAELKDVPVIFLTGKSAQEDGGRAFAEGGVSYVRKPFSNVQIRDLVNLTLQSVFDLG
ncbi:MAG: response regulator [bacterium]|nr:response regulator [bacterium]